MAFTATNRQRSPLLQRSAGGFTYLELLVAITVTSIGICAVLAGLQNGLGASHTAASMELARELAEGMRQFASTLAFKDPQGEAGFGPEEAGIANFDDLDDLNGLVQSPPIRGDGMVMTEYPEWVQKVTVQSFDSITLNAATDGSTPLLCISVKIFRGDHFLERYRWLVLER